MSSLRVCEETSEVRCPVLRLLLGVQALLVCVSPRALLAGSRRLARCMVASRGGKRPEARASSALRSAHRCPFVRLLLLVGLQATVTMPLALAHVPSAASPSAVLRNGGGWARARAAGAQPARRARASAHMAAQPGDEGPVLILGGGWVGSRVAKYLSARGTPVIVTNRDPSAIGSKAAYFRPLELPPTTPRVAFELERRETWERLPAPEEVSGVIVTFPLTCADSAAAFHASYLSRARGGTVLCGSTSVYDVQRPGELVTERSPLKADSARGQVEEMLRQRGCSLLALGGIFGDAEEHADLSSRTVCSCLAMHTAHVPHVSPRKLVNMVHIDDIVAATAALLDTPQPGERVNAISCTYEMRELAARCDVAVPIDDSLEPDHTSKLICNEKFRALLPHRRHLEQPLSAVAARAAASVAASA